MWLRNLLFLGLVAAGVVALGVNLFPPAAPPRVHHFDAGLYQESDFQEAVARVNAAFRQQWAEQKLPAAPPAPDLTVARRLSLALTGTIPSLQEIRQFEAVPESERLAWWLEGIFQDRRHADYVAERLARAYVGTEDGPFVFFRRRRFVSWLSDELLGHRPYDQIVRTLIADTGLWTNKPATNFLTVTREEDKEDLNAERLAGRVTRAFLGIRLDCAQCHNHPYEKWTQRDFQGLAAFFGQAKLGFTGITDDPLRELRLENRKTLEKETIEPHVPFRPDLLPPDGTRRERLAAWLTHPENTHFARATVNRVWAVLFGLPLAEPVDDLASKGDPPPALQVLADDFIAHGYDLRRLVRLIASSQPFRADSAADHEITEAHERAFAAFPLVRLRPEQVVGGVVQSAALETINSESHILTRTIRFFNQNEFVKRYGDTGEDEFDGRGGTIPQRLLLMNGELVKNKTQQWLFSAASRIASLAPDDRTRVETAYLAVLTRRPTPEEAAHFEARLAGASAQERFEHFEDLFWALINATEFAWNH